MRFTLVSKCFSLLLIACVSPPLSPCSASWHLQMMSMKNTAITWHKMWEDTGSWECEIKMRCYISTKALIEEPAFQHMHFVAMWNGEKRYTFSLLGGGRVRDRERKWTKLVFHFTFHIAESFCSDCNTIAIHKISLHGSMSKQIANGRQWSPP